MSRRSGDVPGPLAGYLEGFAAELAALGYSRSAAAKNVQMVTHLSRWLDRQGLDVVDVVSQRVDPFFGARREAGYANLLTSASLVQLARYLRRLGVLGDPTPTPAVDPVSVLIDRFGRFLSSERGLADGTVRFYVRVARLFVVDQLRVDGLDLAAVGAADVTGFTTRVCGPLGLSASRQTVSAMRSFLRFLRLEGVTVLALDQAVLSVAGWSSRLPRAIDAAQVAQLVASCDLGTVIGRRDYAILVLLSRLGFRSGEIVALELGDIDWRAGEIMVRGKRRRRDLLPLPVDVGQALAGYLHGGRPMSDSRQVFLRCFAPIVPLAGSGAVRGVLARACRRAGLGYVCPHRLRHSVATDMLRVGVPLADIGQVLRHRSTATTAIYAAVDNDQVRALARPWPAVLA